MTKGELIMFDRGLYQVLTLSHLQKAMENILNMKKYSIRERVNGSFIDHLLFSRGIKTQDDKEKFLNPDYERYHASTRLDRIEIVVISTVDLYPELGSTTHFNMRICEYRQNSSIKK